MTAGRGAQIKCPITTEVLRLLREVWQSGPNQADAAMLWAAGTMCFFGFLRSGKVVVPSDTSYDPTIHLSYEDVRVDSVAQPCYIEVQMKVSKLNPF